MESRPPVSRSESTDKCVLEPALRSQSIPGRVDGSLPCVNEVVYLPPLTKQITLKNIHGAELPRVWMQVRRNVRRNFSVSFHFFGSF